MQSEVPFRQQIPFIVNRVLILLFLFVLVSILVMSVGAAVFPGIAGVVSPLICPAETTLTARLSQRLQLSVPVFFECIDGQGAVTQKVSGRLYALLFVGGFMLVLIAAGIRATGGYPRTAAAFFNPDESPIRDVPVSMFPQSFLGSQLRKDERLNKLQRDHDSGAVSDDDYEKRRREIMGL